MFPQKTVRVYVLSSYTLYTEVHGKCVIVVYPTIVDLLRHNWLRRRAKTTQATNDIVSFYAVSFGLCVLGFWGLFFFGGFWVFGGFGGFGQGALLSKAPWFGVLGCCCRRLFRLFGYCTPLQSLVTWVQGYFFYFIFYGV